MNSTFRNIALLLLACSISLNSCSKNEPECFQPTEVTGKLAFRYYEIKDTSIVVDTGVRDSVLRRQGDSGMPSPILRTLNLVQNYEVRGQKGVNIMTFPLNPDLTEMQYIFKPDSTLMEWDTLVVKYITKDQFVSNDCGFSFIYRIDGLSHSQYTSYDSLRINDSTINTKGNAQHIQLYYKRN